ncbi:diguanylate cyclase (GGDEF)-like protein [Sinobacterium caligoides]|uniref:diguanylate cyclase n=1 Tax=Sinobacterium caligoides TaxID=933926 RepID=A0A3N2D617_9GAMM|nr:GGDEF domain-containing protein [Sinobacterium caligoides]ROR94924.1 diguanylate cyclase (GGDEF)-like protein [Sinobacterium caligoides]
MLTNKENRLRLITIMSVAIALLLLSDQQASHKFWREIDWLDVIGEGGATAITLLWLSYLSISRPAGRVSRLLSYGIGAVFVAFWMDLLDEFLRLPKDAILLTWVEPIAMIGGLILLSIGLPLWHKEQCTINRQLQKREKNVREHNQVDALTKLADRHYLNDHINSQLQHKGRQSIALVILDIKDFFSFNQHYGNTEGDYVLQDIADLLLLNIRHKDLLCRYAGDSFAVVMPDTSYAVTMELSQQLQNAVQALAYKTQRDDSCCYLSVRCGVALSSPSLNTASNLIDAANQALQRSKSYDLAPRQYATTSSLQAL